MRWLHRKPANTEPYEAAVLELWHAMRSGRITGCEFGLIQPGIRAGATALQCDNATAAINRIRAVLTDQTVVELMFRVVANSMSVEETS